MIPVGVTHKEQELEQRVAALEEAVEAIMTLLKTVRRSKSGDQWVADMISGTGEKYGG